MKATREAVLRSISSTDGHGNELQEGLADCVSRAVRQYLLDCDGHDTKELYQFILNEVERPLLDVVFEHAEGNQSRCAEILGIARGTLRKKLKSHRII